MCIEQLYLNKRSFNRQLFNPTCLKHNKFNCHISTAKNCGTHWLKHMLSYILSIEYDLPPPDKITDDTIVGHTKAPPSYKHIPQIAVTHSHPHYLMRYPFVYKLLHLPKFAVLIRDPREILISIYETTKGDYLNNKMHTQEDVSFSQYLKGDVSGKTRIEDIWGIILFLNSWAPVLKNNPSHTFLMKYEELKEKPDYILSELLNFIGIKNISSKTINTAISQSDKSNMLKKLDPNQAQSDHRINTSSRDLNSWYKDEDKTFIQNTLKKFLRNDYGYDFNTW